jgi:hypothetical protein
MLNDKTSIEELYNLNIFPGLPLQTDLNIIQDIRNQQNFPKINPEASFNTIFGKEMRAVEEPTTVSSSTVPKTIKVSPKVATIPKIKTINQKSLETEEIGAKDPETGIVTVKNTTLLPNFPDINAKPKTKENPVNKNIKVEFPSTNTLRKIRPPEAKLNQQIESKSKFDERAAKMEQKLIEETERLRNIHLSMDVSKLVNVRAGKNHKSYDNEELKAYLRELNKSTDGNKDKLLERILADRKEKGL